MDEEKKLRKKLFIGGAYLVVALLLLIYVSYSAYRIKISARVLMPEALSQEASLDIKQYSQREGKLNDSAGLVLSNLMPNERAEKYMTAGFASASETNRAIKFAVSNASLLNSGSLSPEVSKLKTHYKLRLVETGVVPIEGILVNEDDPSQIYWVGTDDAYERRSATFKVGDSEGADAVFDLSNLTPETHNYVLYLGWNNRKGSYEGSERKEIASVEIQADIVEKVPLMATDSEIPAPTVKWLYGTSTPSEALANKASPSVATPNVATPNGLQ